MLWEDCRRAELGRWGWVAISAVIPKAWKAAQPRQPRRPRGRSGAGGAGGAARSRCLTPGRGRRDRWPRAAPAPRCSRPTPPRPAPHLRPALSPPGPALRGAAPPAAWPARWAEGRRAGGCGAAGRRRRRAASPGSSTVRVSAGRDGSVWQGTRAARWWRSGRGLLLLLPRRGARAASAPNSTTRPGLGGRWGGEERCLRAFPHVAVTAASLIVAEGAFRLPSSSEPGKSPRNLSWHARVLS